MAEEKEVKKLSGEARVDALILELKHKLGFHTSEGVLADAYENDEARKAAGLPKKDEEQGSGSEKYGVDAWTEAGDGTEYPEKPEEEPVKE